MKKPANSRYSEKNSWQSIFGVFRHNTMTHKMDLVLSAIRSIGASFPVASSIVNAWNEYSTNAQISKCQIMVESLAIEINQIKDSIERDKADCAQVFELGMRKCLDDPDQAKATLYSVLIAQFCDGSADRDTAMNLIYEAETLLEYDLQILAKIRGGRVDSTFNFDEQTDRVTVSKCQASIKKLEGKGLVSRSGETSMSFERIYHGGQAWPYTFYQEYYMRSHQGRALVAALERRTAQQNIRAVAPAPATQL